MSQRPNCQLDHLVVVAASREAGAAWIERELGCPLEPGGAHEAMGTHNRLLSLGPDRYLEAIAIDPDAARPAQPRWFDLDRQDGPPRLGAWVVRTDDLDAALARAPSGAGRVMAFRRGTLNWRMAVPESGSLPFDGLFPALIAWDSPMPMPALADRGCRLRSLELVHPEADRLRAAIDALGPLGVPVRVEAGPAPALLAGIETPAGLHVLA